MSSHKFDPASLPDLTGKVFIVTGGNAGIGKATVAGLASHGARVYMGARSEAKASSSIADIRKNFPEADIRYLPIDLAKLQSVVAATNEILGNETELHGLINNAGIMGVPYDITEDGFEVQFQTNYLSHWLLTYRLIPLMIQTAERNGPGASRAINVTSDGHSRFTVEGGIRFDDTGLPDEGAMVRYGHSKLANILHARQLNKLYGPKAAGNEAGEIWVAAVHPGHIDTDLNRQATGAAPAAVLRFVTPIMRCLGILGEEAKGAVSSMFAVASPAFTRFDSGAYIVPYAKRGTPSDAAMDDELATKLWNWTKETLARKGLLS